MTDPASSSQTSTQSSTKSSPPSPKIAGESLRRRLAQILSPLLCLFVLAEVNYPNLRPQSQLAIFAGLGLVLCFLHFPVHRRFARAPWTLPLDLLLSLATLLVCGFVAVQSEPAFENLWIQGQSLGDRAGAEAPIDYAVGIAGLILLLEATRRVVGLALPILSLLFLAYAHWGRHMPDWLFPHRGYELDRIVAQSFLHSQGVFGIALNVMFTYVFLFVVFGAFLEATGATQWIIDAARRFFGDGAGGPAKVSVLSSGLMGSLSGSAVANTATTGTFTIPLMRSAGFRPRDAAGIEAAASSGGALVPPVMGAGAYMMLEIVEPAVTYLEILRAALLPAILYYLALFMIVHLAADRLTAQGETGDSAEQDDAFGAMESPGPWSGVIFLAALGGLLLFLMLGYTVFRAVSLALGIAIVLSWMNAATRVTWTSARNALERASRGGIALIAAAACVGVVLGVVTLTGVGSKLPETIIPLAQNNLFLALIMIMASSIVLGMGLPSAVCYLLLATLIGPALTKLGVVPLAAHLFIFYFGLMSMVTPPVALAAYTAASISRSGILETAFAAFRFAIIGFVLPFLFIYHPQLLMLSPDGSRAPWLEIGATFAMIALGTLPLAAGIVGYLGGPLGMAMRGAAFATAALLFIPGAMGGFPIAPWNLVGVAALAGLLMQAKRVQSRSGSNESQP